MYKKRKTVSNPEAKEASAVVLEVKLMSKGVSFIKTTLSHLPHP